MKNEDNSIPFIPIPSYLTTQNDEKTKKEVEKIEKEIEKKNTEKLEKLKLTNSDKDFLGIFIDSTYLDDSSIEKINNQFCDDSSVQLKNFLKKNYAHKISEVTKLADVTDELGTAFNMCWLVYTNFRLYMSKYLDTTHLILHVCII